MVCPLLNEISHGIVRHFQVGTAGGFLINFEFKGRQKGLDIRVDTIASIAHPAP